MVEKNVLLKCSVCGNVVSVIEAHEGQPSCCGQPMQTMVEHTQEQEGKEKHVPVVKIDGSNVNVHVGSVDHPMENEHYIELIEILKDGDVIATKRLSPENPPQASFCIQEPEGIVVRELCNVHGLWKN